MAKIEIGRITGKDGKTVKFIFTARDAYEAREALKDRGYVFVGKIHSNDTVTPHWTREIAADEAALKAEIEFAKTIGQVTFGGRPVP